MPESSTNANTNYVADFGERGRGSQRFMASNSVESLGVSITMRREIGVLFPTKMGGLGTHVLLSATSFSVAFSRLTRQCFLYLEMAP